MSNSKKLNQINFCDLADEKNQNGEWYCKYCNDGINYTLDRKYTHLSSRYREENGIDDDKRMGFNSKGVFSEKQFKKDKLMMLFDIFADEEEQKEEEKLKSKSKNKI